MIVIPNMWMAVMHYRHRYATTTCMKVIPAVLEPDVQAVLEKVKMSQENGLSMIHLDVMDGKFVANTCFGDAEQAKQLGIDLEVHLMVADPVEAIRRWRSVPNAKRIIVHREAISDEEILSIEGRIGIALNPDTPLSAIAPFLDKIDHVLFMGVTPGWSGQKFQQPVVEKIVSFARMKPKWITIGIDGGMNEETAPLSRDAGAEVINAASFLWKGDTKKNIEWLQSL